MPAAAGRARRLRRALGLSIVLWAAAVAAGVQVERRDADGLRLVVDVDPGIAAGGTDVDAAGLPRGAGPGGVDLPYLAELIAAPPGAQISLTVRAERTASIDGVRLGPADSLATPFPAAAATDLARCEPLGILRGVPAWALTIYPWTWDALTGRLTVHRRLTVDVRFHGGTAAARAAAGDEVDAGLYGAFLNPPAGATLPRPARRVAATGYDPTRPWVKAFVGADGIYRITPTWLDDLGVDARTVDPRTLAMTHAGQPVRLWVEDDGNGAFDGDDAVWFYGRYRRAASPAGQERDHDNEFGRTDTYWLTWGADPGPRFVPQDAAPTHGYPVRDWYPATDHFEVDRTFDALAFAPDSLADRWFWQQERPTEIRYADRPSSQTFTGDIDGFWDEAPYDAGVTVALQGRTGEGFGQHHTIVKLNGETLEEAYWAGQVSRVVAAVVPSSALRPGTNRVLLQGIADRIGYDELWFNWFRLDYRRYFHARGGYLDAAVDAAPQGHRITVAGLTGAEAVVFDVDRGLRLTGGRVDAEADSQFSLTFEDAPATTARYVIAAGGAVRTPDGLLDTPSDWRTGAHGADYVILAHPDLLPAAERLAAHRRGDGLRVAVVSTQDVYDEFNDGRFSRDAIAAFIAHAYAAWRPRPAYVLLLGDETWDYRGIYTGRRQQTLVPTLYYPARSRGYSPSDFRLSLVDGDDLLPDLSIGRLAVDSAEEALTTVDKVIAYDDDPPPGDWRSRALYAANWHAKNEFSSTLDSVAAHYTEPLGLQSVRLYATDESPLPNPLGRRFLEELNHGNLIVNFSGHGAAGTLQYLFSSQFPDWGYLTQVRNGGRLPLMLALSCLNGMFVDPRTEGLSELLVERVEGGAIAYISATAVSFTSQNSLLNEGIYQQLFAEGETRFGPVLDIAKARLLAAHPSWVDVPQTMQLTGDPAQRLALPAGPDYAAVAVAVDDDPVVHGGTARLTAILRNDTRLPSAGSPGPLVVLLGRTADGAVDTLLRQRRAPFAGVDSVVVDWPVDRRGAYTLTLTIDGDDGDAANDRVNTVVDIVEAPAAAPFLPPEGSPVEGLTLESLVPVRLGGDDGSRTEFALSSDPAFAGSATRTSPPVAAVAGRAVWTADAAPPGAVGGAPLFWRVRLTRDGVTSPWSAVRSLRLSTAADSSATTFAWRRAGDALQLDSLRSLRVEDGALTVAVEPPPFRPAAPTRDDGFTMVGLGGAGVLATDGAYLYVKRWFNDASTVYGGTDFFTRVGTGFGGTRRGGYYGVLADSTTPGISATWHDGWLYSDAGHLFWLERIDPVTGRLDTVDVPDGLLDWKTGRVVADGERAPGQVLHAMITSDGRHVYNVSMSSALGIRAGWGVRVFDVDASGWRLAREFVVPPTETGFTYEWTDGVVADGERLYLLEYGGQKRTRAVRVADGALVDEWTSDQDETRVISGQYDPANDRIWLGDLRGSGMFRYRRVDGPDAGTVAGGLVGPAATWHSLRVDGAGVRVEVQAPADSGWQVVARGDESGPVDLRQIDATRMPWLRFVASVDTAAGSRLNAWAAAFDPAADLEVADVAVDAQSIVAAVRNRGPGPAPAASLELLTRSGRGLASQPVPRLAAGAVDTVTFPRPAGDEPLRVWLRPGGFDADADNDRADVPIAATAARIRFRTWPQGHDLASGDAVTAEQGILVEAAGPGALELALDGRAVPADTTWRVASGTRAVLRLAAGRRRLEAGLRTDGATAAAAITLEVGEHLAVRNALVVPNPVGAGGALVTCYLSRPAEVTVELFSLAGRRVRRLGPVACDAGFCTVPWDGRDDGGGRPAAGSYLFVVTADDGASRAAQRGVLVVSP